jgi:hypothetical protein
VEGQSPEEEEEHQREKKPRSSPEEAQKKPNQAQAEEAMGGIRWRPELARAAVITAQASARGAQQI